MLLTAAPDFVLDSFFEYELNLFLSGLPFLIILFSASNWYVLIFVSQFTVSFANYPFTTVDAAIIKNSRLKVFCTKGVLTSYKFPVL